MKDKAIYIIFIFIIIYILLTGACSGTYDNVNDEKSYIEESDGELPEDTVQGNSYTIATNERIEESNGDIDENPIVGTDISLIKNDSIKEEEKEESTPFKENTPEETTEVENESIQEETPEETEDDPILIEDEEQDELSDKDLSEDSFIDDIKHEDHKSTNDEEEKIDSDLHNNKDKTEPIPIKSSLGQIFTLSSKDNKITYLFLQLIPRTGMSTVEIGKDALGMLLNSINLIENAPKRIGKVDYVVVGVEMNPNDVWYFIASVGDLKGYLNGMLDRDQLLDRIEIKKGMPNVFDS